MGPGRTLFRQLAGAAVRARLIAAQGPAAARRHSALRDGHGASRRRGAARLYEQIWSDAAQAAGAELVELGGNRREARLGDRAVAIDGNNTGIDSQETFDRLLDKAWTHARLAGAGLRIPAHRELPRGAPRAALRFLRETGEIVVKPAGGTGAGWGITCGVRRPRDLLMAALDAGRYHPTILLEEQAPGEMYRVLVLDGEVIDVVHRGRPAVTGDGRSSVHDLIAAENRRRIEAEGRLGFLLLRTDLDCLIHLRDQGLGLRSVPEAGRRITVKASSSESSPEDSETVRGPLHPELERTLTAAAGALGLRLAGVDLVTPSLERPLLESGGAIVEVNARPGLRYHYQVRDPAQATPVARMILRRLLEP